MPGHASLTDQIVKLLVVYFFKIEDFLINEFSKISFTFHVSQCTQIECLSLTIISGCVEE